MHLEIHTIPYCFELLRIALTDCRALPRTVTHCHALSCLVPLPCRYHYIPCRYSYPRLLDPDLKLGVQSHPDHAVIATATATVTDAVAVAVAVIMGLLLPLLR